MHALIGYSISEYPALFSDPPPVPTSEKCQTRTSFEQNAFPVCCHNKQRNFTTNQASCSRNIRRRWPSSGRKFKQIKLCLFYWKLLIKSGGKVFCLQMQISWLVHINKLKPKVNNLFHMRMIFNTKRIYNSFWGNFPARAKQMPLKVLFVSKKRWQPQPFGHRAPKL